MKVRIRGNVMTEAEIGAMWGHEQKDADNLWKLGKAGKQTPHPPQSSKGTSPADTLISAQKDPFQTSDPQNFRVKNCVVLNTQFVVICYHDSRKLTQYPN